ncbi:tRNA lysidine(34) synthetase TilS [Thermodesulfobacteriota bacterium]
MDIVKETQNKIIKTISRYKMISQGDTVVTAVSGGPDSVCLLDVLNQLSDELQIKLVVAHYNHGLREPEDEAETILVERLADSMNLPFETEINISLKNCSSSIEENARDARYDFLERIAKNTNAKKIAMGHTLNDQAETVIMRLLRGSGTSGLAGIPPVREPGIIRPMIEINRGDIMSYLENRKLPYAVDSSNSNSKFLRNRIRAELLPLMQEYQPRLIEHLGQLSEIFREENLFIDDLAEDWVKKETETESGKDFAVPLASFSRLQTPLRNRVIRCLLKKINNNLLRIDHSHIISISTLANNKNSQASVDLPNNILVRKAYDRLLFSVSEKALPIEFQLEIDGPGYFQIDELGRSIRIEEETGSVETPHEKSDEKVFLDADKLSYPLTIRNFRPGDRFIPLGMKGHKKIKDFFIDLKVPSETRAVTPILLSGDTPVWVCGFRIDERFKITPQTRNILKVTIS